MALDLIIARGDKFIPGFASDESWLSILYIYWPIALAPALFTWFFPTIMGYRKGGMARVGAAISIFLTIVFMLQFQSESFFDWYYQSVHPFVFVIFFVYGLFGILICSLGIHDGKRSAVWALFGVLAFTIAGIIDTVIWLGVVHGKPMVPYGFVIFCVASIIAFLRVPADQRQPTDIRDRSTDLRNNRTRLSKSIPRTLLRNGNLHLLPVYHIMCLSDLGREGIRNSGSYYFADHIYKSEPSGASFIGKWLDAKFLAMPATQAFRLRYKKSQLAIRATFERLASQIHGSLNLLSVPCGIPRDLTELCDAWSTDNPELLARIKYHGMDLDPALLKIAEEFTRDCSLESISYYHGNALNTDDYPPDPIHMVVSTGLGEFLADEELAVFYRNVFDKLEPGGSFYTSATNLEEKSDRLMSSFELYTNYRDETKLRAILEQSQWSTLEFERDSTGLQTFVIATK